MKSNNTKRLVESAILLGLAFVLSMIKIKIGIFGGSITLVSMLPLILIGHRYGPRWGMICGSVHGLLQIIEGGLYPPPVPNILNYILIILLDYILAWAMVGLLAGIVSMAINKTKPALAVGSLIGLFGRFMCNFLSGVIIWGVYAPEGQSAVIYSFIQNILLFIPEAVITVIAALILSSIPPLEKNIQRVP